MFSFQQNLDKQNSSLGESKYFKILEFKTFVGLRILTIGEKELKKTFKNKITCNITKL